MLDNQKKSIFKTLITPILSLLNAIIPKRENVILLYSANGKIEHNLLPLRTYLIDNNFDKKYRIICAVKSKNDYEKIPQVSFCEKKRAFFVFMRSKYVFYTTGQIPIKPSKSQMVVHLDHGMAFKSYGNQGKGSAGDAFFFTLFSVTSPIYIPVIKEAFGCNDSNICINGELEMDRMLNTDKKYDLSKYEKVIVWCPTFRQSDFLGVLDSNEKLLPLFSTEDYISLNDKLAEKNYLLIVKLHPLQDTKGYNFDDLTNLKIYSKKQFEEKQLDLYLLLRQTDCLIADYSSVFLQFLLLDRPIAFVIPDFQEYKEKRGFVFDNPLDYMSGYHITTKEGFFDWLDNIDEYDKQYVVKRNKVRDLMHTYKNGGYCKRILQIAGVELNED